MAAIPPNNNLEGLISSLKDGIYGAYNKGVKFGRYLALQEYLERKEATQPKWISVEERLPEAKTAVLAYGQRHVFNGKEIEGFPMAHVAYTRGWEEGWFSWDSDHYIDVTHWMPLPEPPKEDV